MAVRKLHPEMLLKSSQVCKLVGISRTTLQDWYKSGAFPAPYKLSARKLAWKVGEIQDWLDGKRVSLDDTL